jgi:hypothetical protein
VTFGVLVALATQRRDYGSPNSHAAEFGFQLADMINFGCIGGAGRYLRKAV